jgi:hypothetical protein
MVLYWLLVDSGGHEQCRWYIPGIRALPVGVAGSPGALSVPRSLKRSRFFRRACLLVRSWDSGGAGGCGWSSPEIG